MAVSRKILNHQTLGELSLFSVKQEEPYKSSLLLAMPIFAAEYVQLSFQNDKTLDLVASAGQIKAEILSQLDLERIGSEEICYHKMPEGSGLIIPLTLSGEKIGVLCFFSSSELEYSLKKRSTIEHLSHQILTLYQFEKKESNLMLQMNKDQAIFEGASDAILLLNHQGVVDCNKKTLEIFGYESKEEILNARPEELSAKYQSDGVKSSFLAREMVSQTFEKGNLSFNWVHRKKNGEEFNSEVVLSALDLKGEKLIQASVRDVNEKILNERKLAKFQDALNKMSFLEPQLSTEEKVKSILKLSSTALNVERTSFWYFDQDQKSITTPFFFILSTGDFIPGNSISRAEFPLYFKEILEKRSIISHDTLNDLALIEIKKKYLVPLNIGAMLENIVHNQTHALGVLCHGHIGESRYWDLHEQAFASSVADRIAIILKDDEIKRGSEEVHKIKVLLEDVEQSALIGGWEINFQNMEIIWTSQTYKIYEVSNDQKLSIADFVLNFTQTDKQKFMSAIENAINFSTAIEDVFECKTKHLGTKWLKIKGNVVCDFDKKNKIKGSIQDITEMKSREIELISTKDRINRIINSSPAVTYERTSDRLWDLSYISHHIYDVSGYTAEEILSNPAILMQKIHSEDLKEVNAIVRSACDTGSSYDVRYRFYHKDGSMRWAWDRGGFSSTKTITGIILDVTREVKATEGMQNLKIALDNTALISYTDLNGNITYVNEKFCELSGYENYELIGKNHRMLKSDEHGSEFFNQMWATLHRGEIWRGQIKNRTKKGEAYWLETVIHPLKGPDGTLCEYLSITNDITKAKRIESIDQFVSNLRAEFIYHENNPKKFYEVMINMLLKTVGCRFGFVGEVKYDENDKVYLKTNHITDISWDEESLRFYQENAPKGFEFRNLSSLFGSVLRTGKSLVTNDPSTHPESGGTPEGHPLLTSFAGIPIFFQGDFVAMVGLGNSEHGFSASFLEEIAPALTVVGEMIDALDLKEQLRDQKKVLEHNAKLASIGQLAAGVGHEINNPLAIMKGIVALTKDELILNGALSPSLQTKVAKLDTSIDRIAAIVKGLRIFSRSDNSELSQFNMVDLMSEVKGLVGEIYSNQGIHLIFEYTEDESFMLFGNRGRIQQVLMNLISNARDAVFEVEFPRIVVSMQPSGSQLKIEVKDNGQGIPPEVREKIYEPFFTTKDIHKGTGIGLSLVSTIVGEHQGAINFISEVGKGTTFTIELPLVSKSVSAEEIYKEKNHSHIDLSHLNVLLVEDEEDLREILGSLLEDIGLKVTMACNGHEALKLLKNHDYQLVLSDIIMPVMSGKEVLHYVRTQAKHKDTKVILMSGDLRLDSYADDSMGYGPNALISKPFNIEDVKKKITQLFKI